MSEELENNEPQYQSEFLAGVENVSRGVSEVVGAHYVEEFIENPLKLAENIKEAMPNKVVQTITDTASMAKDKVVNGIDNLATKTSNAFASEIGNLGTNLKYTGQNMKGGMGKAVSSAGDSLTSKGVKIVEKNAMKQVEKAAVKVGTKTVGKGVFKSALKKIPGASLVVGAGFAYQKIKDGDYLGAALEVASGAAGCVPGVGTMISCGIDAAIVGRDVSKEVNKVREQNFEIAMNDKAKSNNNQNDVHTAEKIRELQGVAKDSIKDYTPQDKQKTMELPKEMQTQAPKVEHQSPNLVETAQKAMPAQPNISVLNMQQGGR